MGVCPVCGSVLYSGEHLTDCCVFCVCVACAQGVKLVSVMFRLHIEFITLKGLMGNENRVSRCQLVTMATEFFLHSGSIEGALKMLRGKGEILCVLFRIST